VFRDRDEGINNLTTSELSSFEHVRRRLLLKSFIEPLPVLHDCRTLLLLFKIPPQGPTLDRSRALSGVPRLEVTSSSSERFLSSM
jgi:hypothetical protein